MHDLLLVLLIGIILATGSVAWLVHRAHRMDSNELLVCLVSIAFGVIVVLAACKDLPLGN